MGRLAKEGHVASFDVLHHDLKRERALSRSLRSIKQVAAAVSVTHVSVALVQAPKALDFLNDHRSRTTREIEKLIGAKFVSKHSQASVGIQRTDIGTGGKAGANALARLINPVLNHGPLAGRWARSLDKLVSQAGRPTAVVMTAEVAQIHGFFLPTKRQEQVADWGTAVEANYMPERKSWRSIRWCPRVLPVAFRKPRRMRLPKWL
jgi:hypothetical protein